MNYRSSRFVLTAVLLLFLATLPCSSVFADTTRNNFLVISDIHFYPLTNRLMSFAPSGSTFFNDIDRRSFNALIAELHQGIASGKIAPPQFIIILGDLVMHTRLWPNIPYRSETYVFKLLAEAFPNTPIFSVFGNNDSLHSNYGPFTDTSRHNAAQSPYEVAKENPHWHNGFLSSGKLCSSKHPVYPCLINEDSLNGYYAASIAPKLRLIALNSVIFSSKRVNTGEKEALDQLQWLKAQLNLAANNRSQVILAMHVPPGKNIYNNSHFWQAEDLRLFLNLIDDFKNTIIGILASHTHEDEIKIIQNSDKHLLSGVYLTAALSTSHGNAPSAKTFFYSKHHDKWALTNYQAYYFTRNHRQITLHKLYNYQDYYCHNNKPTLRQCLSAITVNKMKKFYYAGNTNMPASVLYPDNLYITKHN